jgi:hypothetical protein
MPLAVPSQPERGDSFAQPECLTVGRTSSTAWSLIRTWIILSAFISVLGWILAATGNLDARGYAIGVIVGSVLLSFWARPEFSGITARGITFSRWRWRRPLPRAFAVLFVLVFAGAVLHPPNNYDALTYRVPQMLHWLSVHRWQWVPVSERHINITPPGQGWFLAPMIAILKTDRLFALPNLICFALLPGLFFSVLRACGVRGRVAWNWMWVIPAASCFAMQAGGIGNDLLAAAYALGALALGLRAARRRSLGDFWLSALAAALITGVKITAAPLALPWLVATLPCWKLVPGRWLASAFVATVALVISYLPIAALNIRYTKAWNGDPENALHLQINSPVHGVIGNSLMTATGALEPPVCPFLGALRPGFQAITSSGFVHWLREKFPRFGVGWGELATEESSGVGLGITLLAGTVLFGGAGRSRRRSQPDWGRWIGVASFLAFSAYLAKMGSEAAARLAAPFYPFLLIPILRAYAFDRLVRQPWWQILAVLVVVSVMPAVILSPARPLWPAASILARLVKQHPESALLTRAQKVYRVYARRDDDVAPLKPFLPSDGRAVGYIRMENDIEAPLWKPYGSRRIVEVVPPATDLAELAGSVIIGSKMGIEQQFAMSPDQFAAKIGGQIIARQDISVKVGTGPEEWVVIALGPQSSHAPLPPP